MRNVDPETVHDLVLDSGADSGRLAPAAVARVDVGIVGRDVQGWCSVVGHRQMGTVFDIVVLGGATVTAATADGGVVQQGSGGHDGGAG